MLNWIIFVFLALNLLGISALLSEKKRVTLEADTMSILVLMSLKEAHDAGAKGCNTRPAWMTP